MLYTKKLSARKGCPPNWRPALKRPALVVAAAGQWTFGDIFNAIRKLPFSKQDPVSKVTGAQNVVRSTPAAPVLPPTFQRLSPELVVLLDPKHDRLVYLLSVDESSSADAVAVQLTGLLRAAAAPYVHLMALPADLRAGLLKELPGGRPILSTVPLPAQVTAALLQQEQHSTNSGSDAGGPAESPDGDSVPACGLPGSRPWAPGGVLEKLYNQSGLQPGGWAEGRAAPAAVAAGPAAEAGGGSPECDEGRDMPDEVMSRRRRMGNLMAWRKGASARVARHRGERTPYRFGWVIAGFNSPDALSVVAATPNMTLIRNNVDANLEVDIMQDRMEQLQDVEGGDRGSGGDTGSARAAAAAEAEGGEVPEDLAELLKAIGVMDSDSDDDDDDDDDGDIPAVVIGLDSDGDDADDDLLVESDEEDDNGGAADAGEEEEEDDGDMQPALMSLLGLRRIRPGVFMRTVGDDDADLIDDDGDEDAAEEDEDSDGDEEVPAALMSMLGQQGSFRRLPSGLLVPDNDEGDGDTAAKEQDDRPEGDKAGHDLTSAALISALGRPGPFRQLVPGVFMVDGDRDDDGDAADDSDDGDHQDSDNDEWGGPDTLDVQLSPGPMGWTASLRLGRDEGAGGGDGASTAARRERLLESLRADAEYLQNMGRLEALWEQQAREEAREPGPAGPGREVGQEMRGGAGPRGSAGPECSGAASGSIVDNGSVSSGSGSGVDTGSDSSGSLESDWQQAELRAAASAGSTGRPLKALPRGEGVSATAARGAVPADRLMGPPRRPGTQGAAAASTSGRIDDDNKAEDQGEERAGKRVSGDSANGGEDQAGPQSLIPPSAPKADSNVASSSAALGPEGLVASTRSRRGSATEGRRGGIADNVVASSTTGADGGDDSAITSKPALPDEDGEEVPDNEGRTSAAAVGPSVPLRPTGRSHMIRRPRARMRLSRQPPTTRDAESGAPEDTGNTPSASASTGPATPPEAVKGSHGPASPSCAASDESSSKSSHSTDDAMAIPAYLHLRRAHGSASGLAGVGPGTDAAAGNAGNQQPRGRKGSASASPQGPASDSAGASAGAAGGLPPEAAGYAALDLEQLAQFVLGRQASPEEVQDLARAVAQSADLEAAFGGLTGQSQQQGQQQRRGPLGFGSFPLRWPWRRPGTPPPSEREMEGIGRSRRSVITPRRRRLRIPAQVLRLVERQLNSAPSPAVGRELEGRSNAPSSAGGEPTPEAPSLAPDRPAPREGRKLLSGLALRRLGRKAGVDIVVAAGARELPAPPPAQAAEVTQQRQQKQQLEEQRAGRSEELAAAMVGALLSARPLEQQAAKALVAFLRGRHYESQQLQHRGMPEVPRSWTSLPGLARGRDAVVVLPRALLKVTVGAWHEQEQRLMHEDYGVRLSGK